MIKIVIGAILLGMIISTLSGCSSVPKGTPAKVSDLSQSYPTKISPQAQPYTPAQLQNHQLQDLQRENEQLREELEKEKAKNITKPLPAPVLRPVVVEPTPGVLAKEPEVVQEAPVEQPAPELPPRKEEELKVNPDKVKELKKFLLFD